MSSSDPSGIVNTPADSQHTVISDDSRALANRLSGHMGLDGALQISAENQWHGVVAALLEMKQQPVNR